MTINFGIIGAGAIAPHACREIQSHPAGRVAAVSGSSVAAMRKLANTYDIPAWHENSAELISDPGIDAIYIAMPNAFHAPLAEEALDAGKHVILEKPFAMNRAEADAVAAAVYRSGKLLMPAMNQRYLGAAQRARAHIASGRLGDVYRLDARWRRRSGIPGIGSWFGHKALAGGGAMADIGVHMLDLALFVAGNFAPVSVSATTTAHFGPRGLGDGHWGASTRDPLAFDVEDAVMAFIRLEHGVTLQLDIAWAMHQAKANDMSLVVGGTDASLDVFKEELCLPASEASYSVIQQPSAELTWPHQSRFHNFINAIAGDEAPATSLEEALIVQRVIDAIYASAATGSEIALEIEAQ